MATDGFPDMRRMQPIRILLLMALMIGMAATSIFADQQAAPANPKASRPAVQRKRPEDPTTKALRLAVQRKGKASNPEHSTMGQGKRDPFKVPTAPTGRPTGDVMDSAPGGPLPPGVRGLLISQLKLEGVVRQQVANKMIAVVTNDTRRAYFLTENEAVYNGVVSKITPDAVYFKENVLDSNGRLTTREVVRRLSSAPGEGR